MKQMFRKVVAALKAGAALCGLKPVLKRANRNIAALVERRRVMESRREQDLYDLEPLRNTQELVVFFLPDVIFASGGILSIFNLCAYSRKVYGAAEIILATFPSEKTYSHYPFSENTEKIYRWEQIPQNARQAKKVILHIPEYLAPRFYDALSAGDLDFLKSIADLQINILNQNMDMMPKADALRQLHCLTGNVTQTLAFVKNLQQGLADEYQMPVHLFSTWRDYSKYSRIAFDKKEKLIVFSPDSCEYRERVVETLRQRLVGYRFVTVMGMTFDEYIELISKAFAVITFGEGFDGYFSQPARMGTLSFSVYNETFFPGPDWMELGNVFPSYEDMIEHMPDMILRLEKDAGEYGSFPAKTVEKLDRLYGEERYRSNISRFYQRTYDLLPLSATGARG